MKEQYKPVLGKVPNKDDRKDAMHIAVIPLEVGTSKVYPGEHIGIKDNKVVKIGEKIAIVDPFLTHSVPKGETVWVIMMPYTITGLRHEWTHPSVDASTITLDPEGESRRFLEKEADRLEVSYDRLMEHASCAANDEGYYWYSGGDFEGESISDEFWKHWEKVTGNTSTRQWANFLSCSC